MTNPTTPINNSSKQDEAYLDNLKKFRYQDSREELSKTVNASSYNNGNGNWNELFKKYSHSVNSDKEVLEVPNDAVSKDAFDAHMKRIDDKEQQLEIRLSEKIISSEKLLEQKFINLENMIEHSIKENEAIFHEINSKIDDVNTRLNNTEAQIHKIEINVTENKAYLDELRNNMMNRYGFIGLILTVVIGFVGTVVTILKG